MTKNGIVEILYEGIYAFANNDEIKLSLKTFLWEVKQHCYNFYCEGRYCHYEVIYVQIIVSSIMMINDTENCQLNSLLIQMDKDVGFV